MKKILAILLVLTLALAMAMTGCGSDGASDADQTDAEQRGQTEETAGTEDVDTGGMGELLSSAYVDMMKNKEYLMTKKATMNFEGQAMEMEATVAVKGDDMAITSSGEGFESTTIVKGDTIYMVDHAGKTVTSFTQPQGQPSATDMGTFDAEGITYVGTGSEDGLVFEEYQTDDYNIKYYFDGKDLVKIALFNGDEKSMEMEILEMSNNVPADMFEIPAGYQQITM